MLSADKDSFFYLFVGLLCWWRCALWIKRERARMTPCRVLIKLYPLALCVSGRHRLYTHVCSTTIPLHSFPCRRHREERSLHKLNYSKKILRIVGSKDIWEKLKNERTFSIRERYEFQLWRHNNPSSLQVRCSMLLWGWSWRSFSLLHV